MTRKRTVPESASAPGIASGAAAPARAKKPAKGHSGHGKTAGAQTPVTEAAATVQLGHDEIARLAYSYWEARGGQGGSREEDWLRAEQEIRALA